MTQISDIKKTQEKKSKCFSRIIISVYCNKCYSKKGISIKKQEASGVLSGLRLKTLPRNIPILEKIVF